MLDKEDTYCLCCQKAYPDESAFFGLCCSNEDLQVIGTGYPLLFEFIKYIGILMFILTIIYFGPVAYLIFLTFQKKIDLSVTTNPVALASFGAFLIPSNGIEPLVDTQAIVPLLRSGKLFQDFWNHQYFLFYTLFLLAVSILVSLMFIYCLRSKLN